MHWFNRMIVNILPFFPKSFIWLFSRRYIAGKSLSDGVGVTKELNRLGCRATVDVLGEEITTREEAVGLKEASIRVLEAVAAERLDANLSLKLTSMGLRIDKELCFQNVEEIVDRARQLSNFVRIDMEDSTRTSDTLDIYRRLRKEHDNVGVVIQAYLKRSRSDVQSLIDDGIAHLRICKGIYKESPEIAFKDKEIIRENYFVLLRMMLESGCFVGIATHDKVLVKKVVDLLGSMKIPKTKYEFQMLLGVTENLRADLVSRGLPLRVYIPYGEAWYGYSIRRLKENPKIAGHITKNIFIRG
jgi:proline dehydrogenase